MQRISPTSNAAWVDRQGWSNTRGRMAETFDLVLSGATVVNHDGAVARDIGIRDGKIVALGTLPLGFTLARYSSLRCSSLPRSTYEKVRGMPL